MATEETQEAGEDNKEISDDTKVEESENLESKEEGEKESLLVAKEGEIKEEESGEGEQEEEKEIEYDLKLPEDAVIEKESLDSILEFAKENKLSNEAAQKLVDKENEAVNGWIAAQQEEFSNKREEWIKEAKDDKEFGRDNFDKTSAGVKRLLSQFGDEELENGLTSTGFDAYVPLWRFLARIDAARQSDKIAHAETAASAREIPIERLMYPSMHK